MARHVQTCTHHIDEAAVRVLHQLVDQRVDDVIHLLVEVLIHCHLPAGVVCSCGRHSMYGVNSRNCKYKEQPESLGLQQQQ